jgi:hypothetical protein
MSTAAGNNWASHIGVCSFEREYITHLRLSVGIDLTITAIPSFWSDDPPRLEGLAEEEQWRITRMVVQQLLGPLADKFRSADEDGVIELVLSLIQSTTGRDPIAVHQLAQEVVSAPVVVVERSPPSGQSLASVVGAGGAALVTMHANDPLLLVWGVGALVVVRVADPVLAAVGELLAARIRGRPAPTKAPLYAEMSELESLREAHRTLAAAVDADKRRIARGETPSHVFEDFLSELEALEERIKALEDEPEPHES